MGPMPARLLPLLLLISCPTSLEAATSVSQISSPRGGKIASFLKKVFGTKSDTEENDIRTHGFWSSGFHAFGQPHAGFPIRSSFDRPAPHHGAVTPFTGGTFNSSGSLVISGGSLQKVGSGQLTLAPGSSWETFGLSESFGSLTIGGSNLLDFSSDFTLTWNGTTGWENTLPIVGWNGLVSPGAPDTVLFGPEGTLVATGSLLFVDPYFNAGSASPITSGPVPEPSAVLLALAGATAFFRRRRN